MNEVSDKSRRTAALLAGFLGIFGIHRLYLDRIGTGVAMLILGIAACSITGIYFSVAPDFKYSGVYYFDFDMMPVAAIITYAVAGSWAIIDFAFIMIGKMRDRENRLVKKW
jgi:TM2 domain-containing membrane protein YozV